MKKFIKRKLRPLFYSLISILAVVTIVYGATLDWYGVLSYDTSTGIFTSSKSLQHIGNEYFLGNYDKPDDAATVVNAAGNCVLYLNKTVTMDAAATFNSNVLVQPVFGYIITGGAYNLLINKLAPTPLFKWFNQNSTGRLLFGNGATYGNRIFLEWWDGDCGDGATDCASAFDSGIDSVPTDGGGGIISMTHGIYNFTTQPSDIDKSAIWIEGSVGSGPPADTSIFGSYVSIGGNLTDLFKFTDNGVDGTTHSCGVRNLAFRDSSNASAGRNYTITSAIHVHNSHVFKGENLYFYRLKGSAIKMTTCSDSQWVNATIDTCGDTGKPSLDLDSAAAGLVQAPCFTNLRVEVSTNAENIYVGTNTASGSFTNVVLENTNIATQNGTLIHDAGYKMKWVNVNLNAHHGNDERMEITGDYNAYTNFKLGSLSNGTPSYLIYLNGATHNTFSNFGIRETVLSDGARYFFKLSNLSLYNEFDGTNLSSYGGWDIDSGCGGNNTNNVVGFSSYAKIANINSGDNRLTNLNVTTDGLASGDLITCAGHYCKISGTFASLDGVDNVINLTGNYNEVDCIFDNITNTKIVDGGIGNVYPTNKIGWGSGIYDYTVNGAINSGSEFTLGYIPDNARIMVAFYEVLTTFTSTTDAATLAVGIDTNDVSGIVAAIAISNGANPWDAGSPKACIQDWTVTNMSEKTTAARAVELENTAAGGENLTAGKIRVWWYFITSE